MATNSLKGIWRYFLFGAPALALLIAGWVIFKARPATPEYEPPALRLMLVGDTGFWMKHRVADYKQEGYRPCFQEIRKSWEGVDFLVGNLEMVIGKQGKLKQLRPGGALQSPEVTQVLKEEGFFAFTLANNHVMDFGVPGWQSTRNSLLAAGIRFFGAGDNIEQAQQPLILEKNGLRIGILALCEVIQQRRGDLYATPEKPGTAPLVSGAQLQSQIADLKKQVDFVVVFPHWGHVFDKRVMKSQRRLAKEMIAAGADVVIGHHPHITQEVEIIDGRPVLYSIGNGLFHGHPKKERNISPKVLRSMTAELQFSPAGLQRIVLTPFNTNNLETDYIPQPLSDREASSLFRKLLKPIKGRWNLDDNRAMINLL